MPTCNLTKKTLSHILLHAFCLHFLRIHHDYFFMITISFRKYKRKVVIYLFNAIHLSQLSSCWIWHLTSPWAQFLSNKSKFFVSCNIKITKTSCSVFWYVLFCKNLIVLHHVHNNFLFWHLYQIHNFRNNFNNEEMITSHLMCVLW